MNFKLISIAKDAGYGERWNTTEELEMFLERYGKLIVKECARLSERAGALNEADYEGEMIADAIKEYFGAN